MVRRINKIQRLIGKATKITGDAIKEGFQQVIKCVGQWKTVIGQ